MVRIAYYIPSVLLLILVAWFIYHEYHPNLPSSADPLDEHINEVEKVWIDISRENVGLFISLAMAIVGGTGFFLKASIESRHVSVVSLIAAGLSIIAATVSIFFGHMAFNIALFMLSKDTFPEHMRVYVLRQYVAFLFSLLFFVTFISSVFWETQKEADRDLEK